MAIASNFLIMAKVMHKRLTPRINAFVYDVFYLCFDIEKIDDLKSKFFSINKFNFFSFYLADHGAKDNSNLYNWAVGIFKQHNVENNIKKIYLFTHPRVLGYCFNPVSFWFGLDKDEKLIAVIAQVNNTFNQSHCYLLFNQNFTPISVDQIFRADKDFYVSPFYERIGSYNFRFIFDQKKIAVWIDYIINEKTLLTSVISKKIINYSDKNLLICFLRIPFLTLKVIILIHWQALKLFIKKMKYIGRPAIKKNNITLNKF